MKAPFSRRRGRCWLGGLLLVTSLVCALGWQNSLFSPTFRQGGGWVGARRWQTTAKSIEQVPDDDSSGEDKVVDILETASARGEQPQETLQQMIRDKENFALTSNPSFDDPYDKAGGKRIPPFEFMQQVAQAEALQKKAAPKTTPSEMPPEASNETAEVFRSNLPREEEASSFSYDGEDSDGVELNSADYFELSKHLGGGQDPFSNNGDGGDDPAYNAVLRRALGKNNNVQQKRILDATRKGTDSERRYRYIVQSLVQPPPESPNVAGALKGRASVKDLMQAWQHASVTKNRTSDELHQQVFAEEQGFLKQSKLFRESLSNSSKSREAMAKRRNAAYEARQDKARSKLEERMLEMEALLNSNEHCQCPLCGCIMTPDTFLRTQQMYKGRAICDICYAEQRLVDRDQPRRPPPPAEASWQYQQQRQPNAWQRQQSAMLPQRPSSPPAGGPVKKKVLKQQTNDSAARKNYSTYNGPTRQISGVATTTENRLPTSSATSFSKRKNKFGRKKSQQQRRKLLSRREQFGEVQATESPQEEASPPLDLIETMQNMGQKSVVAPSPSPAREDTATAPFFATSDGSTPEPEETRTPSDLSQQEAESDKTVQAGRNPATDDLLAGLVDSGEYEYELKPVKVTKGVSLRVVKLNDNGWHVMGRNDTNEEFLWNEKTGEALVAVPINVSSLAAAASQQD